MRDPQNSEYIIQTTEMERALNILLFSYIVHNRYKEDQYISESHFPGPPLNNMG